jgi:hypothetical protein
MGPADRLSWLAKLRSSMPKLTRDMRSITECVQVFGLVNRFQNSAKLNFFGLGGHGGCRLPQAGGTA